MDKTYAIAVLVFGVILIIASLMNGSGLTPDTWLIEWTDWAINYVGLAVAAHAIVKLTDGYATYLKSR